MARRRLVVSLGAVALLGIAAGGGYLWAGHVAQARLRDTAEAIRAGLGPQGSLTWARATVHPLSRSAELTDVSLHLPSGPLLTAGTLALTDGGGGRLARVHADRLRLEAPGGVATAATLDARDLVLPPPVPGQPYRIEPDAVFFGALSLDTVAATASIGSAQLARLEVEQYGAGRRSTLRARALSLPVARVPGLDHAGFDAFSTTGSDLAALAGALSRGETPPRAITAGTAELDGAYMAQGSARPVRLASLHVATTPGAAGASASTASLDGLVMEPVNDAMRAGLASLGLQSVQAGLSWSVAYDAAGGRGSLSPMRLTVEQLGTLTVATELAHLDPAALAAARPDPAAEMAAMAGVQLVSLHATLADAGLLSRLLQLGAQRTGAPAPQLRAMLAGRLAGDPAVALAMPDPAARAALGAFVTEGGTLSVAMVPPAPLLLGQLAQLGQGGGAMSQLGLTITRSPP